MANEVKIKITTDTSQAQAAVRNVVDTMTSLKSAIDLAGGTAQKLKQLNDQFFDMGRQGANIAQTEASFTGLINKVGTYPDLLERLRTASRGTIDDQKLMASTTTLLAGAEDGLALSLANATPQLLEIAKAANKLNPTLGDTAFLYESISTGIKRGSPMILDNLGITIKIGEANQKYAKALGKTVEQLTSSEQKQALLNATLEAGNTLMEQAGGNADATADAIARMETAQKNADDQRKGAMAPYVAFVAEIDAEASAVTASTKTGWLRYIPVLNAAQQAISHGYGAVRTLTGANRELDSSYKDVIPTVQSLVSGDPIKAWADRSAGAMDGLNTSVGNSLQVWLDYKHNLENITQLQQDIGAATVDVKTATDDFGKSMGGEVLQALKDAGVSGEAYNGVLGTLDGALGTNYKIQKEQADAIKAAVEQYKKTGDVAAFGTAITNLKDQFAPFDEAVKKATDKVYYLNLQLDQLNRQINIDINVNQHGSIPGSGGGSGQTGTTNTGEPIYGDKLGSGGQWMIPPGYEDHTYPVGNKRAQSGEIITVTPKGQTPGTTIQSLTVVLPGVTNVQQFMAELGRLASRTSNSGGKYAGR